MKNRLILLLLVALTLTVTGCLSPSAVEPGDGPAATADPLEPTGPEITEGDPADEDPNEDGGDEPPAVASFKDKYVYPDGVEVEVTKIGTGKLGEYPTTSDNSGQQGDPYIAFSIRVRNGSRAPVSLIGSTRVTYGPDGEEAPSVYESELKSMDGKVIPGKAKTGSYGFIIPTKHRGDVVLEFSPDFEHETAEFAGSIK